MKNIFLLGETQKYFISNYKATKGRNLMQFWVDAIEDKGVLELLSPECSVTCVTVKKPNEESDKKPEEGDSTENKKDSESNVDKDGENNESDSDVKQLDNVQSDSENMDTSEIKSINEEQNEEIKRQPSVDDVSSKDADNDDETSTAPLDSDGSTSDTQKKNSISGNLEKVSILYSFLLYILILQNISYSVC